MKPSEVLKAAREKISTPEKWTKGKFARNSLGLEVPFLDQAATCWCLVGALSVFTHGNYLETRTYVARAIGSGVDSLSEWNDEPTRSYLEIIDALTRAAQLAESEGQ
jgi:hypothetical protein